MTTNYFEIISVFYSRVAAWKNVLPFHRENHTVSTSINSLMIEIQSYFFLASFFLEQKKNSGQLQQTIVVGAGNKISLGPTAHEVIILFACDR